MPQREPRSSKAASRHANMVLATDKPPLDMTQLRFDYEQIAPEHRQQVKDAAADILAHGRRAKESIIAMGDRLIEVKALLPDGTFTAWLTTEFELSPRMAQNFMNVARQYGERPEIISVLNDTVLYLLAAPSTPEEARQKVEQAATSGQKVTVSFAKEAVRKTKPEPVQYAPVWKIEGKVKEWLSELERTGEDVAAVLAALRAGSEEWDSRLRDKLDASVEESCRKRDRIAAVANIIQQRRQAAAQAQAVYVEPTEPTAPPPAYAPYWRLLGAMRGWLSRLKSEGGSPLLALTMLKRGRGTAAYRHSLEEYLRLAEIVYREGDLPRAIEELYLWHSQIEGAEEQVAIAEVAAEAAEEDAEREAQEAQRAAPFPSKEEFTAIEAAVDASVMPEAVKAMRQGAERSRRATSGTGAELDLSKPEPTAPNTVTVVLPRTIAEQLKLAAAEFKLGYMRLVDQAWLEEALTQALQQPDNEQGGHDGAA